MASTMKRKRRRLDPKFVKSNKRSNNRSNNSTEKKDCISSLPDDVLKSILSRLTMKEAARTSVVSTRWKDLWTHSISDLNFDALEVLRQIRRTGCGLELERAKYVSWVNWVLKLHKGATLDQLRIHFDLDSKFASVIDSWLNFALDKRVKRLEFNFRLVVWKYREKNCREERYCFPMWSVDFSRLEFLTAISFTYVHVTEECVECFLSSCPLLEELSVDDSTSLVNLKVYSRSLRHLKIFCCWNLINLEISAENMKSFEYYGGKTNICFERACNLSQLCLGSHNWPTTISKFIELSSYISQLQTLELHMDHRTFKDFPKFRELRNLKQLRLKLESWRVGSFLPCISLVEACPCLHLLCIQICTAEPLPLQRCHPWSLAFGSLLQMVIHPFKNPWQEKVVRRPEKRLLTCPKVLEYIGFGGHDADVELVMYLLENVVSLQKTTIDTCRPDLEPEGDNLEEDENRVAAKRCARKLQTKLPLGVELTIL